MSTNLSKLSGRHGDQTGELVYRHINSRLRSAHDIESADQRLALLELGDAMRATGLNHPIASQQNDDISAGYTYLGQFIGHDLSFNPVTDFEGGVDARALRSARTPRLDLDSIYGRGRNDQPYLYMDDGSFLTGRRLVEPENGMSFGFDLPRQPAVVDWIQPVRAIIADPRNDENRILGQIHSVFLQFHNHLLKQVEDFEIARRLMRWHYQWIVLSDYLPKIVGREVVESIVDLPRIRQGKRSKGANLAWYKAIPQAWIPIEFAAAAFRFGHSMVRPSYHISAGLKLNRQRHGRAELPIMAPLDEESLRGRRPLQPDWAFDWDFFFLGEKPEVLQPSLRIDTLISEPLFRLREAHVVDDEVGGLAGRTLLRGAQLRIPSGERIAKFFGQEPLSPDELYEGQDLGGYKVREVPLERKAREALRGRTPLWYYLLREAELRTAGKRLGPIGGRIVAEVLIGLLFADPFSFLNADSPWRPDGSDQADWGVRQLIDLTANAQ